LRIAAKTFDLWRFYTYNIQHMRNWKLTSGDPLQLTIAADARLTSPDYLNDHIWEMDLSGGDPSALGLRTTYGLRARLMRIFPRFIENGKAINDPAEFAAPPCIRSIYPNFIEITFSPLPGVDVTAEYWIPASNVVAGRLSIANHAVIPHLMQFELVAQLIPLEGQSMGAAQRQSAIVLQGQVDDLIPVLFITGGPQAGPGPYPALALPLEMPPGNRRQFSWALAATQNEQESFDLARRTAARPLDAERARIELLNASQTVEIITGDADWNAALALSQKTAFSLFIGPSPHLPHPSFVLSRHPDQGFSRTNDGSDYQYFWDGQSPLEAYYLASVLPGAPQLARGILQNFLSVQEQDGFIDCKPGLSGQRGRFLAAPYLASLGWQVCEDGRDIQTLTQIYPKLASFFWAWFSPARDQDRNGLPEWQHPLQTGFEENPLFDGWHAWAIGVNVKTVQSPALSAALYREAQILIKMAEALGHRSEQVTLKAQSEILRKGIEACWDADGAFYRYADRDTHLSLPGKTVLDRTLAPARRGRASAADGAAPSVDLKKEFKQPVRLILRIHGKEETLKRPQISIFGRLDGEEQQEILSVQDFAFSANGAVATSRKVYTTFIRCEYDGLGKGDRIDIDTVDLTVADHTLLTPLWAKVPTENEAQAIIFRTILNAEHFDHPYGIPALPRVLPDEHRDGVIQAADPVCLSVHLVWNQLIGEGMLSYGYRRETARLVAHLMSAIIQNLKRSQAFYRNYHAETGAGMGERNALHGLAPVGLFLRTLGVEILSPLRVRLSGENPFPWPVTVKYRGLTVTRHIGQTEILFPNGQSMTCDDPTDAVISCDEKERE
jgi:hypothetical protein